MARTPRDPALARRRRRWAIGALLLGLAVWGAVLVTSLVRVTGAAGDVQATLDELRRSMSVDSLTDGTARELLQELHAELAVIDGAVDQAAIWPLRIVPGVGRQIRAAEAISTAGLGGADIGVELLDELTDLLDRPLPRGAERVALIDHVTGQLAQARGRLSELELGGSGPLLPPLAEAHGKASSGLADLDDLLGRGESFARSVRALFADADHLLLAANNAEMRAGSGMFLQVGMLEGGDGTITPGPLTPAEELRLPPGAVEAGSPAYDELWGFLRPTVEWRNLGASPRFDVTAELAARMWAARGNPPPTGVLAVDPHALRALLAATGPVTVDGMTVGSDDVVGYLLNGQYAGMGASTYQAAQAERRDRLGGIVDAAFGALETADVDPVTLVQGLRDAVRGRHLLAWSPDPDLQAGWRAMDMAGELDADSLLVSVLNRGANKLDPFLEVSSELSFASRDDETWSGVVDVVVRNAVPDGQVRYVAGPWDVVPGSEAYGDYIGILSVNLPGAARNAGIDGVPSLEVASPDGPVLAIASKLRLAQGEERRFRVTFELPRSVESVVVEPDARPQHVRWRAAGREWADGQRHRVQVPG